MFQVGSATPLIATRENHPDNLNRGRIDLAHELENVGHQ
jgi:hypothetical protein